MANKKIVVMMLLACCMLVSCSRDDSVAQKGKIDKFTDQTADRISSGITSSLDAAKKAASQVDADIKQKEKMLHESDN